MNIDLDLSSRKQAFRKIRLHPVPDSGLRVLPDLTALVFPEFMDEESLGYLFLDKYYYEFDYIQKGVEKDTFSKFATLDGKELTLFKDQRYLGRVMNHISVKVSSVKKTRFIFTTSFEDNHFILSAYDPEYPKFGFTPDIEMLTLFKNNILYLRPNGKIPKKIDRLCWFI